MQTFTWKRITAAAAALSLAACANLSLHDKSWTTLFDGHSNLNGYTVVGDGNWRIQDGLLQADLIQKVGPSYLVTKESLADQEIYAEFWVDQQRHLHPLPRPEKNWRRQLLRNQHLGHPA